MVRAHILIELTYEQDDQVHWNVTNVAGQVVISSRNSKDGLPFASPHGAMVAACNAIKAAVTPVE
jgi:hypothetical protein